MEKIKDHRRSVAYIKLSYDVYRDASRKTRCLLSLSTTPGSSTGEAYRTRPIRRSTILASLGSRRKTLHRHRRPRNFSRDGFHGFANFRVGNMGLVLETDDDTERDWGPINTEIR